MIFEFSWAYCTNTPLFNQALFVILYCEVNHILKILTNNIYFLCLLLILKIVKAKYIQMKSIHSSLIISAYNRPEYLRFCLTAVLNQIEYIGEIIVCDDGSNIDLKLVIKEIQADCPVPIIHVYQENRGFRLARNRNNGLRVSGGEYIFFLDHDCLPSKNYFKCHLEHRKEGYFFISNCIYLDEERTGTLTVRDVADGNFLSVLYSREHAKLRSNKRKDNLYTFLRILGLGIKNRPKLKGGIFSIHRTDIDRINGFDEKFVGWGQEDDDLRRRLFKIGFNGKNLGIDAFAVHLYHPPASSKPQHLRESNNFSYYTRDNFHVRCEAGIVKLRGETEEVKITCYNLREENS